MHNKQYNYYYNNTHICKMHYMHFNRCIHTTWYVCLVHLIGAGTRGAGALLHLPASGHSPLLEVMGVRETTK